MKFLIQESWTVSKSIEVDEPDRETALNKYYNGQYDDDLYNAEPEEADDLVSEIYDME